MAVSGKNPLKFTAATDAFARRTRITAISCVTAGTAGAFKLLDAAGGNVIFHEPSTVAANTRVPFSPGDAFDADGIYVETIPADAAIYVYIE